LKPICGPPTNSGEPVFEALPEAIRMFEATRV
jgi:hypothetical protein